MVVVVVVVVVAAAAVVVVVVVVVVVIQMILPVTLFTSINITIPSVQWKKGIKAIYCPQVRTPFPLSRRLINITPVISVYKPGTF